MRHRTIQGLLALLFLFSFHTYAGEALWTHQFAGESGFPTSLSRGSSSDKRTLVLFWASWCLPCKGELADLAAHPDKLPKDLRVIAISVDDPSGMPLAQSFLSSIHWPFEVLRDNSGQFFFDFNRAGQLPFSVLLGPEGQEIKTFQGMTEADFQLLMPAAGPGEPEHVVKKGVDMSYGVHAEGVDFSGNNSIHNRMVTSNAYARLDSKYVTGQVQYDYMYEEMNNPTTVNRGDEIGYSFAEFHGDVGPDHATVRGGDSHMAILGGELLSLQNIPSLTDPASLRGATAQWDHGDWSASAFIGSIHPALFVTPINPTTELALPVAGESAHGASLFWHHDGATVKNQLSLNIVNYHRDVDTDLGYATQINDQRLGGEYYLKAGNSGLQVRAAQFSTNTGVQGVDAVHPYIMDPYVWWTPWWSEHQVYSFHYIEYQSLPARTLIPVLVENPALPLQVAKIRSFRLSPKYILNDDTIWFEPIWIFEESRDLLPYERQNSYGVNLSLPKRDQKLVMFYQDGVLSAESKYQESSVLATSPLGGPFSTQLLVRHHQSNALKGDSDGLVLGADLGKMMTLPFAGRFLLSAQWTKQSGYYYGFSGIARSDLFSGHIEWTNGVNAVRLGFGGEPGGIVCTNGVCVQKPPLNGADLDVSLAF